LDAAEDLSVESEDEVKAIVTSAFKASPIVPKVYSELANAIRIEVDHRLGRGWNVVVGKSFGAYVTQKLKCYIYLSVYTGVSVLIWKA
jgi:hypothetical protein